MLGAVLPCWCSLGEIMGFSVRVSRRVLDGSHWSLMCGNIIYSLNFTLCSSSNWIVSAAFMVCGESYGPNFRKQSHFTLSKSFHETFTFHDAHDDSQH